MDPFSEEPLQCFSPLHVSEVLISVFVPQPRLQSDVTADFWSCRPQLKLAGTLHVLVSLRKIKPHFHTESSRNHRNGGRDQPDARSQRHLVTLR